MYLHNYSGRECVHSDTKIEMDQWLLYLQIQMKQHHKIGTKLPREQLALFLEMDQKHTSGNWTVCMFFLIKLLKCRKNITERRNICQLSSYSIFVALLGQKFGTGISFSSGRGCGWPKAKSLIWVDHRIWFKSAMMEIERCFSSHLMDSYLSLSLSAFLDWKPFNKGNFCTNGLLHWYLRKKRTGKIR